jgi:hypothetical protein
MKAQYAYNGSYEAKTPFAELGANLARGMGFEVSEEP